MKGKIAAGTASWLLLVGFAYAGAWGEGSFDNDDALDWVAQCIQALQ